MSPRQTSGADTSVAQGPKPPIPFCERKPPFYCKNHPGAKATRMCDPCKEFFCNACAKMVENNPICPDCSAQLKSLSPEEQEVPALSFAERVGEALAYPFRGSGKIMLVLGAIFLWILSYAWLLGAIMAAAFMYAYFAKVCRTSASGRESPPDWPESKDLGTAFYFFVAKLFSLAPALLYVIFVPGLGIFSGLQSHADDEEAAPMDEEEVRYREMAKDKDLPAGFQEASKNMVEARHPPRLVRQVDLAALLVHIVVILCLYAVGSFYLPMALLALLLYRNYEVLNPKFVLASILRVRREYLFAYLVLIVTDVVGFVTGQYGRTLYLVGPLFGSAVWLYLMMSQMHVLGRLYLLNQNRLGWFRHEETA